ncbi:N-acetylglucosamine-6-phosphate deacetylase [Cytobacillus oceanisediminis]|uniref:N-acetylglucosamine-6-phosphate deacetylase n=2 Tax=Cytobacillus oceanisediminis TaxID=665099 RepID=A0A2V2ZV29_9BACI|nr:N-acetylglucosamine-6-phosphate deacetylase [Cytobacillus oceanisediminis]
MENNSQTVIHAVHYKTGQNVEVKFDGNIISEVNPAPKLQKEVPFIAPGLIDLQINGYVGIDFNTLPIKPEEIRKVTKELWKQGVTTYFPTIITNSPEKMREALKSIREASQKFAEVEEAIGGIHLEGPFISPEDGPRGAHRQEYVRSPDWDLFCTFKEAAGGKIKMITLSPEWENASEFIKKCTNDGILVSIGHTAASPEKIQEAVKAGARMSTHLGNGAHPMLPRHPNYIWEQLANDDLASSIIADGFHLPDSVLKVILQLKGNKTILVSDSVSLTGMLPGEYSLHIGGKVVLTPEGRLHMAESPGLLAGSVQTQLWGINHLLKRGLCHLNSAIDLAALNPSLLLHLPVAHISQGNPADFILFYQKKTKDIELFKTFKNGKVVYENKEVSKHVSSYYDELLGSSDSTFKTSS